MTKNLEYQLGSGQMVRTTIKGRNETAIKEKLMAKFPEITTWSVGKQSNGESFYVKGTSDSSGQVIAYPFKKEY
jgi:hypothetical protein